ncbi:ABC transporter permease [Aquamicrobium sp. LC103]|uniref:ABC transporter permease n=1 Tax=Aquamicrobium sp. LC103 TaxID=1120658 RepID=UPI00063E81C0|nr:ABC transporter permease [Aquamicrobium sp. LC103]TKT69895.1 ABC transporter permease [Aquamicrobium sp. LC103]
MSTVDQLPTETAGVEEGESMLRRQVREYFRSPLATAATITVATLILMAFFAPLFVPQNPYDLSQLDIMDGLLPPGESTYSGRVLWLGSDEQGRDIYSAILFGLRTSLTVGFLATAIACMLGTIIGVISAYVGGWVDSFVMRVVDLQLSLPSILVALVLLAAFGRGIDKVIAALVIVQWAYYARTVRAAALVERGAEYVEAARCLMLSNTQIVFRHVLPNCMPPIIVVATAQIAHAIALEATLSFLGAGVPVTQPSLGMLIASGYNYLLSGQYWISTYPGVVLVITVGAINLMGDRLRDVLNPRLAN